MKRRLSPILFLLALMFAFASCAKSAPAFPSVEEVARDYRSLQLMTPKPVQVNAAFARLCRGLTQEEIDDVKKEYGPHFMATVKIYMSESAATAFGKPNPRYPVGSIVVKEKDRGVGGMIKRPPGYDPEHGDWEYFYFDQPAKIERGKISSCVACHAGAQDRDHVFGDWSRAKPD